MKNGKKGLMIGVMAGVLSVSAESSRAASLPAWPIVTKGIKVYSNPEDQAVYTNGTAVFTVVAEPKNLTKTLTYLWQKNGTTITASNITGVTSPSLFITNVQVSDVGFYLCVVNAGKGNLKVGSADGSVPGARLFVLTGTHTGVSGPILPGTGTESCVGSYTGSTLMLNTSGTTWWTPPTGSTNCTISDISDYGGNTPVVEAIENGTLKRWCSSGGTGSTVFPVTSGHLYQFYDYYTSPLSPPPWTPPHPRSGDPLSLWIVWSP